MSVITFLRTFLSTKPIKQSGEVTAARSLKTFPSLVASLYYVLSNEISRN
jgi:hypothetical protein